MSTKKSRAIKRRGIETLPNLTRNTEPGDVASIDPADVQKDKPASQAHTRLGHLIWNGPGRLDGATLPATDRALIPGSTNYGMSIANGSPWIDFDTYDDGRVVQVQLRTWHEDFAIHRIQANPYAPSTTELDLTASIWLRACDPEGGNVTKPEELFRFPNPELALYRGEPLAEGSEHWEEVDRLIGVIEAWRQK